MLSRDATIAALPVACPPSRPVVVGEVAPDDAASVALVARLHAALSPADALGRLGAIVLRDFVYARSLEEGVLRAAVAREGEEPVGFVCYTPWGRALRDAVRPWGNLRALFGAILRGASSEPGLLLRAPWAARAIGRGGAEGDFPGEILAVGALPGRDPRVLAALVAHALGAFRRAGIGGCIARVPLEREEVGAAITSRGFEVRGRLSDGGASLECRVTDADDEDGAPSLRLVAWLRGRDARRRARAEAAECARALDLAGVVTPGARVLELGSGPGLLAVALAPHVREVHIWAPHPGSRRVARVETSSHPNIHPLRSFDPGDAAHRGRYDVVVIRSVLGHVAPDEPASWVPQCRGMLARGGCLCLFGVPPEVSRRVAEDLRLDLELRSCGHHTRFLAVLVERARVGCR